jgi:crossover junction endodeoxyribonuclease RusA
LNTVEIPYPPVELNPNSRKCWQVKANKGKKYKNDVYYLCKAAKLTCPDSDKIDVWLDAYPPNKHERDGDNLVSSLKWGFDAIAEYINKNDKYFVIHPPVFHAETENKVVVKITEHVDIGTEKAVNNAAEI